MILQAIFEQLICGYRVQKLGTGLFYIPSQELYIEVKTDSSGKVKELLLSDTFVKKEKERKHGKQFTVLITEVKEKYHPKKVEKNPLLGVECIGYLKALKDISPTHSNELSDLIVSYELVTLILSL